MEKLKNLFVGPAHLYTLVIFLAVISWVLYLRGIRVDETGAKTIAGMALFALICRFAWDEGYASNGWGGMSLLVPLGAAAAGVIWFYPGPSNGFWWWAQIGCALLVGSAVGWRAAITGAAFAPKDFDPNYPIERT